MLLFHWANHAPAQDHTVLFDTSAPGESKAITEWGLDTAWPSYDNMRRGLVYMGDQVDFVRIAFPVYEPLNSGELGAVSLADVNTRVALANMAGASVPLTMTADTGAGVHASYKNGNQVIPSAWTAAMEATVRAYEARGKTIVSAAPFNEPDYGWNQGTIQNLYDICILLQASSNFTDINLAGGSTLSCDAANAWYDPINSVVEEGTTHQLAGSFDNYVGFYQNVIASGDQAVNEEVHNVSEVIIGAEYGLDTAIWWGTAELARGSFIEACQGMRLGYAENRPNWTAAAVYRAPDGAVQAFVGESERQALPTTYRFFSKDRDVFYDGHGPQRAYTVATTGGPGYQTAAHRNAERMVNITWGADVPPPINGRYIVVNRASSRVMQVAGGSADDGANIQQYIYGNALYQQWDIVPLSPTEGFGDYSFYSITAAHSGKAADVFNFSYDDGGDVRQWADLNGVNQHWFLDYAGNGWFHIRSRWSGKYLEAASTALFANIQQGNGPESLNQQWRLIPVGAAVEFVPPAAPTNVVAVANALSVQLNWTSNTEPDLAGYTVLRATNVGGPYDIVARGLTNNTFTDKSANRPLPWYYIVRAVDRSLNTSTSSTEVSATPTCTPALAARHSFEGTANDSSGNANHPIIMGSPSWAPGQYGQSMDLNGTSQCAMLPANLLASVTNFTIALWVNWDGGGAWQRIFDFGNDTTQYMFLTPNSGSGTLRFAITTNSWPNNAEQILETSPLPVGQWQHVAVTRNGNAGRLYTNGVLAATGTLTIPPASFDPALNHLGDSQYDSDPFFNGRLDELFIYNHALSDTEITHLAANQPPPPVTPTTLSAIHNGDLLGFSWPSNYLGCRLESNSISLTAPGSWFTVPGSSATNQVALPINDSSSNVFFRLVYP